MPRDYLEVPQQVGLRLSPASSQHPNFSARRFGSKEYPPQQKVSDATDATRSDQSTAFLGHRQSLDSVESNADQDAEATLATATMELEDAKPDSIEPDWKAFGLKVATVICTFLLLTLILEKFAEKEVAQASKSLMNAIGLPGLFFFVLVADAIPQPFSYVPLIFMAVKGSMDKTQVFAACVAGSYIAAMVGYTVGYALSNVSCASGLFEYVNRHYPVVPDMMARKGNWGVALAALLPVPLAVATWTAGSFGVPFRYFCLAGACRAPKILLFVLLSRGPSTAPGAA